MKIQKKYKKRSTTKHKILLYLCIYDLIKKGKNTSDICKILNIKKSKLNYYISTLKKQNYIKKIGYGVWEINKELDEKEVQQTSTVANLPLKRLEEDDIRLHALIVTIKIKKNIRNWDERGKILLKNFPDLQPKPLKGGWGAVFKGLKIHLWNESIVIYQTKSFMGKIASKTQSYALSEIEGIIRSLENRLASPGAFRIGKGYKFKVSREHYAMVKNALARQYRKDGSKLNVYGLNGLWLLIDFSDRIDELEVVSNKKDNTIKTSEEVQSFWNDHKKHNFEVTASFVLNTMNGIQSNQSQFAEQMVFLKANLQTHFKVLNGIGGAVELLSKEIKKKKINNIITQPKTIKREYGLTNEEINILKCC